MPSPMIFDPSIPSAPPVARPILASDAAFSSGVVQSGALGNAAVLSGHLASGVVGSPHLSSGAVRSGSVGDGAVVSGSIASGSVGGYHLASGVGLSLDLIDVLIHRIPGEFGGFLHGNSDVVTGWGLYNPVRGPSGNSGDIDGVHVPITGASGGVGIVAGQFNGAHQLRWDPLVFYKDGLGIGSGAILAFVGLTTLSGTVVAQSGDPNGGLVGFQFTPRGVTSGSSGETTWAFVHKASGTAITRVDSGVKAFASGTLYHRICGSGGTVQLDILDLNGAVFSSYVATGNLPSSGDSLETFMGVGASGSMRGYQMTGANLLYRSG